MVSLTTPSQERIMTYSTRAPKRFFKEQTGFGGSTPPIPAMGALLPSGPVLGTSLSLQHGSAGKPSSKTRPSSAMGPSDLVPLEPRENS